MCSAVTFRYFETSTSSLCSRVQLFRFLCTYISIYIFYMYHVVTDSSEMHFAENADRSHSN